MELVKHLTARTLLPILVPTGLVVSEKKTKMSKFMDDNVNYDDGQVMTIPIVTTRPFSLPCKQPRMH
jgi:hypothetical protein